MKGAPAPDYFEFNERRAGGVARRVVACDMPEQFTDRFGCRVTVERTERGERITTECEGANLER